VFLALIAALMSFAICMNNTHCPHRRLNGTPLQPAPEPLTKRSQLEQLTILRRDRLSGVLHEYQHAAAA
jgi:putative transposase